MGQGLCGRHFIARGVRGECGRPSFKLSVFAANPNFLTSGLIAAKRGNSKLAAEARRFTESKPVRASHARNGGGPVPGGGGPARRDCGSAGVSLQHDAEARCGQGRRE